MEVDSPILLIDGSPAPVVQSLWQVRSDGAWRIDRDDQTDRPEVSGPMLAALRLANLVETLDEIVPALLGSPAENWTAWLAYWRGQIDLALAEYNRLAASAPGGPPEKENFHDAESAIAAADSARQRLAALEEALPPTRDHAAQTAAFESEPSTGAAQDPFIGRIVVDGPMNALRLLRRQSPGSHAADRWLGGLLLAVIALGGVLSSQRYLGARIGPWSGLQISVAFAVAVLAIMSGQLGAILGVLLLACAVVVWNMRRGMGGTEFPDTLR
jgi:hypothetical protein